MNTLALRNQILRFIYNEISLKEFEEWFVSNLNDLLKENDAFTAAVELALAEYSDGIRDLENLKEYFHSILQEFNTINISYQSRTSPSRVQYTLSGKVIRSTARLPNDLSIIVRSVIEE
ncbi:hypothetical protein [Anaerolinea sp.]|uniref:hypothetical protein n=1 Tax=Anaerolinea sp. TaxID=1872519 RepID=UPI002ACD23FC|nr:hypothetical protein [Anaerolinea sp.]